MSQPRLRHLDVERDAGLLQVQLASHSASSLQQHLAISTPLDSPDHSRTHSSDGAPNEKLNPGPTSSSESAEVGWRDRIKYFTWTWFTMTMATGQVSNVLYDVPFRFRGLYAIGCIFFILNICLFIFNIVMISLRFRYYPSAFLSSLKHSTESLFIPASVISLGTILLNITEYGTDEGRAGEWLDTTMVIMFWIYCGLAVAFACGIYLIMWSTQTFTIAQMTPVWIFPAYPLLVIGPHAGILSRRTSGDTALDIIVGGFTLQGIGFMVSLMVYAAFLYRLMTNKLPKQHLRPGMFISVGPSGFTISGVINMGQEIQRVIPPDFMGIGPLAGTITMVVANWMGIWLWGLAIFFFIVSVGAHWSCLGHGKLHFDMTWYSFIFPNTALVTSTFAVAKALDSHAIRIVGCVMTCLLLVAWFCVFGMMIRAVLLKQILWPQKPEVHERMVYKHDAEEKRRKHAAKMKRRDAEKERNDRPANVSPVAKRGQDHDRIQDSTGVSL